MSKLFDLTGEIAAVVGATGALGGSIAEGLARHGAKVAVMGRNEERGMERVEAIRKEGGWAEFIRCEVKDRSTVEEARQAMIQAMGEPTILVNASGGNDPKVTVTKDLPFQNILMDDWIENVNLNLVGGVLIPCQVFGPSMCERRRGSIINIASVSGHIPLSRVVAYSSAKAGVLNLSRFIAREWAKHNVRVNTITPGFFPAQQNKKLLFQEDGSPTERAQAILSHTSMGRFGDAEEIQGAAVFLASEKASGFVTGTDIRVDGGFLSQTI